MATKEENEIADLISKMADFTEKNKAVFSAKPSAGTPISAEDDPVTKKQKALLDYGNAAFEKFKVQMSSDPAFAASVMKDKAFQKKASDFGGLIDEDKARYEERAHKPYVYSEPAEYAGDKDGQKGEVTGAALGDTFASWYNKSVAGLKNLFSGNTGAAPSTDAGDDIDPVTHKRKSFFDSLNVGDLIGGVLGVGGGYMLGNLFGGGLVGQIAGVLLAIGGFFMGEKALGGTINGWLGKDPGTGHKAESQQQQLAIQRGPAAPAYAQQQAQAVSPFTDEQLIAIMKHHAPCAFQNVACTAQPSDGSGYQASNLPYQAPSSSYGRNS